jgi:hypothetical protein
MDSIATARDFFINQQGMSPDQADMIVSQGLQAYNQQTQPRSMMQMASGGRIGYGIGSLVKGSGVAEPVSGGNTSGGGLGGMGLIGKAIQQNPQMFRTIETSRSNFIDVNQNGIDDRQEAAYGGRIGYQMGGSPMGIQSMPMDYGQSLQVPTQQQPMFTSTGNATSSPLLNYGQTNIGKAGGTPLTMRSGGIARLGYQEGGMTMTQFGTPQEEPIFPRLETLSENLGQAEEKLGTPSNNQFGISPMTSAFTGQSRPGFQTGGVTMPSQGSELSQMQQMDPQQALQTIIQILIENGVPPEQAQQLALQILQIFAQGGEPAVEQFANQLEQEEVQAMASGGIAGYGYRQGYFLGGIGKAVGSVFKGAAKAVSGVVKGVANAVKSVVKSDIGKLALLAGGAYLMMNPAMLSGFGAGAAGAGAGATALETAALAEAGLGGLGTSLTAGTGSLVMPTAASVGAALPATAGGLTAAGGSLALPAATSITADALASATPGFFETAKSVAMDPSFSGIKALGQQGLSSIANLGSEALDYASKNKISTALTVANLASLGAQLGMPRNEGEDDESYAKRLQETQGYLTNYGRNLKITNPYFYQREGAVNPFAPTMAANGGIMGYAKGGSMIPPARQIEGGIIELDARKTGGYIPYGKKERVDDVPAMLAKDEFVFTSRAVKAAGGGSARRGAAKMYALMKQLESKGARA